MRVNGRMGYVLSAFAKPWYEKIKIHIKFFLTRLLVGLYNIMTLRGMNPLTFSRHIPEKLYMLFKELKIENFIVRGNTILK